MPTDLTPRRRSEKSRTAIVTATRELLLERGFDGLTIEAVAARAGVGKQTIYRWWRSRPALVADVMLEDADKILASMNHTDDLAGDLVEWVGKLAASLTTARGAAMLRTLTVAGMEHEDTAVKLRDGFSSPLHHSVRMPGWLPTASTGPPPTRRPTPSSAAWCIRFSLPGNAYSRRRAELTTRLIVDALTRRR